MFPKTILLLRGPLSDGVGDRLPVQRAVRRQTSNCCPPHGPGPEVAEHVHDEETNDMVGYLGDDRGDPTIVRAGSIACFWSTLAGERVR